MDIEIKRLYKLPSNLLQQFFYRVIYVPGGQPPFPFETIYKPELYKYIKNLGDKRGDIIFTATAGAEIAGIVWVRLFSSANPGCGYVSDYIPELSISIKEPYQRQGIGTRLIKYILSELEALNCPAVSINVDARNPAKAFYDSLGFEKVKEQDESEIMLKKLR